MTYARHSTDRQNDRSIADQQRLCAQTCRRLGLPPPSAHFADAARSGASLAGRDGLRALLEYAAQPTPRGVRRVLVVESLDRLGRNIYDSFDVVRWLHRDGGIRIVTADGRDSDTPAFKATLLADSFAADALLDHLRTHTRRGLEARIAEGRWVNRIPLGYRLVDGRLVWRGDDTPEVGRVRQEFKLVAAGMRVLHPAKRLDAQGYRVEPTTMRHRLRNPIYRGDVYSRGQLVRHDESLRIISDEVWHRVQEVLRTHAERHGAMRRPGSNLLTGGAAARRALLSGLFRCGLCSTPLVVEATAVLRNGVYTRYYGCPTATHMGTCSCRSSIRGDSLEPAVVRAVLDAIADDRAVDYVVREVERRVAAAAAQVAGERRRIERSIRDAETRLRRCVEFIERGESVTVRARIAELEAKIRDLRTQADALRPAPESVRVLRSAVVQYLGRAAESLRSADPVRLRAALDAVITDGVAIPPTSGKRTAGEWRVTFRVAPLGVVRELLVGPILLSDDKEPEFRQDLRDQDNYTRNPKTPSGATHPVEGDP